MYQSQKLLYANDMTTKVTVSLPAKKFKLQDRYL